MPAPEPGAEIRIWADLHFDDERIRRAAERPWPAVEPMNAALRRSWRESMATGTAMVCAGDIEGRRTIMGRRRPPDAELSGPVAPRPREPRLHARLARELLGENPAPGAGRRRSSWRGRRRRNDREEATGPSHDPRRPRLGYADGIGRKHRVGTPA